ncbi:MAG: MFS transporter [Hyphomicrobiales bacterium]|nr:MAG: MFS transporter [Hyphomicrobiales bacterium]
MAATLAPITALLIAVAMMLVGHGLQTTVLPIRADMIGFGDLQIGLISSAYFAGFIAGCILTPHAILRAGHIRAFAAIVSLGSAAALAHPLFLDPSLWIVARAFSGFAVAGFYIIVESWLNERATNKNRGTVMSIYIVVNFTALSLGQVATNTVDVTSFAPFALASIAVSLAVIPVALTRSQQPAPIMLVHFRPRHLYRTSPTAMIGAMMIGIANGAVWTLAPIFGTRIGLSTQDAVFLATAIIVGGGLGQWPFGRLSDFMDRRFVLMGITAAALGVSLVFAFIPPSTPWALIIIAGLFGVFSQPAYAIAVAHAFDYAEPDSYVETSSGLLLAFATGSVGGPIIASMLMKAGGPNWLFVMVAVVQVSLIAYLAMRLGIREAPEEKTDWDLGSTAPVGGAITPEPLDTEDPDVYVPEASGFFSDEDIADAMPFTETPQEAAEPEPPRTNGSQASRDSANPPS